MNNVVTTYNVGPLLTSKTKDYIYEPSPCVRVINDATSKVKSRFIRDIMNFCSSQTYNFISEKINYNGEIMLDTRKVELKEIYDTLQEYLELKENWDYDGGRTFSKELIDYAYDIVKRLCVLPEVFPTGRGTVQLEYENNNGYLEFEIYPDLHVECYREYIDKSSTEFSNLDTGKICKMVDEFNEK